jgi:hypothetical protein
VEEARKDHKCKLSPAGRVVVQAAGRRFARRTTDRSIRRLVGEVLQVFFVAQRFVDAGQRLLRTGLDEEVDQRDVGAAAEDLHQRLLVLRQQAAQPGQKRRCHCWDFVEADFEGLTGEFAERHAQRGEAVDVVEANRPRDAVVDVEQLVAALFGGGGDVGGAVPGKRKENRVISCQNKQK